MGSNPFTHVPKTLVKLVNLTELDLSFNRFERFDDGELLPPRMRTLRLNNNLMTEINVTGLTSVTFLDIERYYRMLGTYLRVHACHGVLCAVIRSKGYHMT